MHTTSMTTTHTVQAEPLRATVFAPFGQVLAVGDAVMELRDGEVFHLNVLHYDRKPLRCDHLNPHHMAIQDPVARAGKAALLVVAPAACAFSSPGHLEHMRAFVCDG